MEIHQGGPDEGPHHQGRGGRLLHPGWPASLALLIAYGSLLPFDWRPPADYIFSDGRWFTATIGSLDDLILNLLLYTGLGALAACACRARIGPMRASAILLGAGSLSLACELGQLFVISRVTSLPDVICNVCGAALGLPLGAALRRLIPHWSNAARNSFARGPFQSTAAVLSIALLVYGLGPFDFVTGVADLHRSFGRANLAVSVNFAEIPGNALAEAGWFVILGLFAALAALERLRPRSEALVSAVRHGLILIVVIELLQVLLDSKAYESSAIMLRVLAVCIGAWIGSFWIDLADVPHRLADVSPHALAAATFLVMAYLIADGLDSGRTPSPGHTIEWLPFLAAWRASAADAAFELLWVAGCYFSLAVTLRSALAKGGSRVTTSRVVLIAGGLSLLCEVLTCMAGGTADATRLVLALFAAVAAMEVLRPSFHCPADSEHHMAC